MSLRATISLAVIYQSDPPATGRIGQLWMDTDIPELLMCTSLSPLTYTSVGGGGGGAPTNAEYVVGALNGTLTNERLLTDTGTVTWDLTTGGQAKANVPTFTSGAAGVVPASGGGTTNFLRADGSWAAPPSGGSPAWGTITGTLSSQTDLQTALDAKVPTSRTISTTAPLTGGGDLSANRTFALSTNGISNSLFRQSAGVSVVGRATNTVGDVADIAAAADDTVLRRTGGALDFGQLTVGMAPNSVWTYAKIQNVSATSRFLGRITAGAGVVEELTGTQATTLLDAFTSVLKGLVPASGGGTTNFLRADGSWAAPGGGGSFSTNVLTAVPSADQADWNPGSLTGYNLVKANPSDNSFITGIAGGSDGMVLVLMNGSTSGLVWLIDEDSTSTAANRFTLSVPNRVILPGDAVTFYYDGTTSRWIAAALDRDLFGAGEDGTVILPNTTTSVSAFGQGATSNTATLSTTEPTATPGNVFVSQAFTQVTNSTASGSSDVRGNVLRYMRGASANRQGIFYYSEFRNTALGASGGVIVGMTNSTGAITTQPRSTNNTFGIGTHGGETSHSVYSRDGAAATSVSLGANFPSASATAAYAVAFLAMPNTANIRYMVLRLDSRFTAQGTISANLPANTLGMAPRVGVMVGATAVANTAQFTKIICKRVK